MTSEKIKAIRGMHDITPDRSGHWARIERAIAEVFASYVYREIRLPIVEKRDLFQRSIGEVTDIVEKEMYTFRDRNDEQISLRPEGTAGCVRACIENNLLEIPQKLWYQGPMFRYERPQKGRQRQFHQIGAEVFGFDGVEIEAEILLLNQRFWRVLGLDNIRLQLNNIGCAEDRARFKSALQDYLLTRKDSLDEDSQRRLSTNPLRILDSKSTDTQAVLANAPQLSEFLGPQSRAHHESLLQLLAATGVEVEQNEKLVRGLDYYNDTVFEWISDDLGAQSTVCGGGRYDGLVQQLGGKPVPAVGFAMGMERLYLLLEAKEFAGLPGSDLPDAYLIVADSAFQARAFALVEQLRSEMPGFSVQQHLAGGSMKSQFKKADRSGARFALILAENEINSETVAVKDLSNGEQRSFSIGGSLADLLAFLSAPPEADIN